MGEGGASYNTNSKDCYSVTGSIDKLKNNPILSLSMKKRHTKEKIDNVSKY